MRFEERLEEIFALAQALEEHRAASEAGPLSPELLARLRQRRWERNFYDYSPVRTEAGVHERPGTP